MEVGEDGFEFVEEELIFGDVEEAGMGFVEGEVVEWCKIDGLND